MRWQETITYVGIYMEECGIILYDVECESD